MGGRRGGRSRGSAAVNFVFLLLMCRVGFVRLLVLWLRGPCILGSAAVLLGELLRLVHRLARSREARRAEICIRVVMRK